MSKDIRDDYYQSLRKPTAPPTKVMNSKKDYIRNRQDDKRIIEQELEEMYED